METIKSKYFTLDDLTRSVKAKKLKIDNTPTEDVIERLQLLITEVLDPAREKLGEDFLISSGYRSFALNEAMKGVRNSQHIKGEAVDIQCSTRSTLRKLFNILQESPVDQLFYECRADKHTGKIIYWIHVSYKSKGNRNYIRDNYITCKSSYINAASQVEQELYA